MVGFGLLVGVTVSKRFEAGLLPKVDLGFDSAFFSCFTSCFNALTRSYKFLAIISCAFYFFGTATFFVIFCSAFFALSSFFLFAISSKILICMLSSFVLWVIFTLLLFYSILGDYLDFEALKGVLLDTLIAEFL